jgi:hypothetical protein
MTRATSAILVFCGTLLLATWLVTPATSAPQTASRRVVPSDATLPPELAVVEAEVTRLRARVESRVNAPEPARDPFHFAARARLAPPPSAESPSLSPVIVEEPVIAWPTLVAILESADGTLQAAVADGDDALHVVSAGDEVAGVTVAEISAELVTLSDRASGQSRRLSVR